MPQPIWRWTRLSSRPARPVSPVICLPTHLDILWTEAWGGLGSSQHPGRTVGNLVHGGPAVQIDLVLLGRECHDGVWTDSSRLYCSAGSRTAHRQSTLQTRQTFWSRGTPALGRTGDCTLTVTTPTTLRSANTSLSLASLNSSLSTRSSSLSSYKTAECSALSRLPADCNSWSGQAWCQQGSHPPVDRLLIITVEIGQILN